MQNFSIGVDQVEIAGEARGINRTIRVWNEGAVPVWIGPDPTTARGFKLWPGWPPYEYDRPDELFAVAQGNPLGLLLVEEVVP